MPNQMQLNQGPQDALLYDNTRSYFTNVGYVRTSNFQVEYKTVDSQNNCDFGTTTQFVIPKAADLLGPVDLRLKLEPKTFGITTDVNSEFAKCFTQWVDELGFAMIDKITFAVGSTDIESITGEQMQIRNELMTSDEMRLGHGTILKTGRRAFTDVTRGGYGAGNATYMSTTPPGELPGTANVDSGNGYGPIAKGKGNELKTLSRASRGTMNVDVDGTLTDTVLAEGAHALISGVEGYGDIYAGMQVNEDRTRLIEAYEQNQHYKAATRELIIPLQFFFTKHVSQYFPLAAVAGCNDIRISVKLRPLNELLQIGGVVGRIASGVGANSLRVKLPEIKIAEAKMFCHFVHVTGPEAQTLMNKEHVRLLKLFQHQHETFDRISGDKLELNLSFLHPVSTLIITIRAGNDMNSQSPTASGDIATVAHKSGHIIGRNTPADAATLEGTAYVQGDYDCVGKGFFFYHGDGTNPNYDRTMAPSGDVTTDTPQGTVKLNNIQLTLNGQERHPGLDKGLDVKYLQERLLPMLHSNSSQVQKDGMAVGYTSNGDQQRYGLQGSKNIFVYPFSLNPEGSNPSGAVNFSKVSHGKLTLHLEPQAGVASGPLKLDGTSNLPKHWSNVRVDVYALYYNWLQIKDGRALLSFA